MKLNLFGVEPSIFHVIEHAPAWLIQPLIEMRDEGSPNVVLTLDGPGPDDRARLLAQLAGLGKETRLPLVRRCERVRALAEGKGPTSLQTVAEQRLFNSDLAALEAVEDDLGRSIWTLLHHPAVFDDAESFHDARRYRDNGKLYDAFEIDLDHAKWISGTDVPDEELAKKITSALGKSTPCTVAVLTLPANDTHHESVLVIVRHAGPLSSVADHRNDGRRSFIYYRPSRDAALIYTPATKTLEVSCDSPEVRRIAASTFATVVLGQDVSAKPLAWKRYNLSRFRESLSLNLPAVASADVRSARVIEFEVILGQWRRKLSVKVTHDDDIAEVVSKYLPGGGLISRSSGFGRVVIAVRYVPPGSQKPKTMNITVTGSARCNLQSIHDAATRSLGYELLEHWGILTELKELTADEERDMLPLLLELYDHEEDELAGGWFTERGNDPARLMQAAVVERCERHDALLLDDGGEGNLSPSKMPGHLMLSSQFGPELGHYPATQYEMYTINRAYLEERLLRLFKTVTHAQSLSRLDDNLVFAGTLVASDRKIPLYLARRLSDPRVLIRVNEVLRREGGRGDGVVISAGDSQVPILGENAIVRFDEVSDRDQSDLRLSAVAIVDAFDAKRRRIAGLSTVELIHHSDRSATLVLPGLRPLTVLGANQVKVIRRLVDAHNCGRASVATAELLEGIRASSPSQVFGVRRWKDEIAGVYIEKVGSRSGWRIPA